MAKWGELKWGQAEWGTRKWSGPEGYLLDIYRGEALLGSVRIDEGTRLIQQLMGENIIKSVLKAPDVIDIKIGDYIVWEGIYYYVNALPNVKKNSSNSFDYDITFESQYYELLKTQFMDLDENSDFYLVGNVETFIDLIVTNMNRTHAGWAKGTCDQTNTDYKLLNFSKNNCMQVLQKLHEEFEGEFYFNGKNINFTDRVGSDSGLTFRYHQGLRNIHRTTLSEKNIITRLYAFGSEKNLASDYRDHCRRLKFVLAGGESYLEKNIDKYGTIEHTEIFNDIYPHREGTISAVDGGDITKFTDSGMDFNLNDYLLPGVTAKLHFNSGDLGGYEFEVYSYNNVTKEFTIIAFKDEQGYDMPNDTLKPAIGDKYVLLDIKMPQTYIDTAETNLKNKAQEYLDDNCSPRVTYLLVPDWRYFKANSIALNLGDFITIEDTDLNINSLIRIVELTRILVNAYKYTLKLSDHLEAQLIQRLYSEQEGLKEKIEVGDVGDIIRARRSWRTSEELRTMIFDTDGYFDMGNIRPASVETGMLSVGAKSTQFILKEIQIEANYTGDKSKFHASAGELIHLSIAEEIRTWTLSENTQDSLVDATPYYIYAKCTKEAAYTGQIIVDETQRKFDDDPTYYYFLIGVLHSVVEGVRGVSLTYGQTVINGKFITTGSITADRLNISNVADIGNIILGNTGYIRTTGKDSYANNVAGFWLGYDVDKYKLNIGNASRYLKWTGSQLEIKGNILAGLIDGAELRVGGSGSNQEIYFKDSGIYIYDYAQPLYDYRRIGFRYNTLTFARLYYQTIAEEPAVSALRLKAGDYEGAFQVQDDGEVWIDNYDGSTHRWFGFHCTGALQIIRLANAPTPAHDGDCALKADTKLLRIYSTYWSAWFKAAAAAEGW